MGLFGGLGKLILGPVVDIGKGIATAVGGEAAGKVVGGVADAVLGTESNKKDEPPLPPPPEAPKEEPPKEEKKEEPPKEEPKPAPEVVTAKQAGQKITNGLKALAAAKVAKSSAQSEDDEFNIAKNFLDNSLEMLKQATYEQFNILIVTDGEKDEWWKDKTGPEGRILPMPNIEVKVAKGKTRTYQVYVFDTGTYVRKGSVEADQWTRYGESKIMKEPLNGWTHVEFNDARPKKNPDEIDKFIEELEGKNEKGDAARDAVAALNEEGDVDDEEFEEEEELEEGDEELEELDGELEDGEELEERELEEGEEDLEEDPEAEGEIEEDPEEDEAAAEDEPAQKQEKEPKQPPPTRKPAAKPAPVAKPLPKIGLGKGGKGKKK